MKQCLIQKRDQFYVSIRKVSTDKQFFEKRWQCLKTQKNDDNYTINNDTINPNLFSYTENIKEGQIIQIMTEINTNLDKIAQMKRNGNERKDLFIIFQKDLVRLVPDIIKNCMNSNNYKALINLTYLFNSVVCNQLIKNNLYEILNSDQAQMMMPDICMILSNIFIEDDSVKFTFKNKEYKHQFYQLINKICMNHLFTSEMAQLLVIMGTNSFTPHQMIVESFGILLKAGYEDSNVDEISKFAMQIVDKNQVVLHGEMMKMLLFLNIGGILSNNNFTKNSKYHLLRMITQLIQYDHQSEQMERFLTPSLLCALEGQIKSLCEKNKILTIKLIKGLCYHKLDQIIKLINSNIIELLLRILQIDTFHIKVDVLIVILLQEYIYFYSMKTLRQCLKCQVMKEKIINLNFISYIVPLLRCDHRETVIQSLKCLKTIFQKSTQIECIYLKNQFYALNGQQVLESIFDIDPLVEQLINQQSMI